MKVLLHWLCDLSIPTHAHMGSLSFTQPSRQRLAQRLANVIWYDLVVVKGSDHPIWRHIQEFVHAKSETFLSKTITPPPCQNL